MTTKRPKPISQDLTAAEETAIALQDDGLTYRQIAKTMASTYTRTRKLIKSGRTKLSAKAATEAAKPRKETTL